MTEEFLADAERRSLMELAQSAAQRTLGPHHEAVLRVLLSEVGDNGLQQALADGWIRLIGALWLDDSGSIAEAYTLLATIFSFGRFDEASVRPEAISDWRAEIGPFRRMGAMAVMAGDPHCASIDEVLEAARTASIALSGPSFASADQAQPSQLH